MKTGQPEMKLFSNVCSKPQVRASVEQGELQKSINSAKLVEVENFMFCPEVDEDEDFTAVLHRRRPSTPQDYTLAIDYTAAKTVNSVIDKCKEFQRVTMVYKDESHELLSTLVGLHEILQIILGLPSLNRFQEVLEDIMLYSTKAFAFVEKLICKQLPSSTHGVHKAAMKLSEFACRFFNYTVRLCEEYETSDDKPRHISSREERLSFGVTTYSVLLHKVAERLLKKKRAFIPLRDLDGKSGYNVELSYPRSWWSKDSAMSAKIESTDRGFSQTLQAGRVKLEKGSWGWEDAQDTVHVAYDDLVIASVAAVTGSLLSYNKQQLSASQSLSSFSPKAMNNVQKYRTSIQIVGSSRIDLDLQNLFIKGKKDKNGVYYKCFVNVHGREEVLGIYRYQQKQFLEPEGMLHIVGRGNQPGLRHVLVSIFASLGFPPAP